MFVDKWWPCRSANQGDRLLLSMTRTTWLRMILLSNNEDRCSILPMRFIVRRTSLCTAIRSPNGIFRENVPMENGHAHNLLAPKGRVLPLMRNLARRVAMSTMSARSMVAHRSPSFRVEGLQDTSLVEKASLTPVPLNVPQGETTNANLALNVRVFDFGCYYSP